MEIFIDEGEDLNQILENINKQTGYDFREYRKSTIIRRVKRRMNTVKVPTYKDYLNVLETKNDEYKNLIDDLTINVTDFFRDPEVFEILEENVFPQIIDTKKQINQNNIKVWCIGCATGEEVYSIAISLNEFLLRNTGNFIFSVLGTDIDSKCIERAISGKYSYSAISKIENKLLEKYFHQDDKSCFIKDDIKKFVKFEKHDLIQDEIQYSFDLILCRNLLIYFLRELQEKVLVKMCNILNQDGFLVLGKSEALIGCVQGKFKVIDKHWRIYKKGW